MLLFFLFLQIILADGKQVAGFLRKKQEQDSTTATTSPTISSVSLITSTSPTAASSQLLLSKQTSSASSRSSQLSKLDALRNFDQPYSPTTLSPVSTTTTPVTVTSSPTTTTTTTPMITSSPTFTPISSSAASAAAVSALTMSRLDALRQDFVPGSSSINEAIEPETVSSSSSSLSETVLTASLTAAASTASTAASASTTTTTINNNKKNITVGAYYYPWHNDDFHNDQGYLRAKLYPQQGPELGEYDDTEKYTIQQHIKFSDLGNINLWVTSWWGPERIEDITTQDTIMNLVEKENHPLKIALLYETTNRLTIDGEWALNADRVQSDIEYIQKEYFDQYTNSYYMIDGKPVIFIYLARKLERFGDYTKNESLLQRTVALMRETATQDIYVVGDHGFDPYPDDRMSDKAGLFNSSLLALDAISNCTYYALLYYNDFYEFILLACKEEIKCKFYISNNLIPLSISSLTFFTFVLFIFR